VAGTYGAATDTYGAVGGTYGSLSIPVSTPGSVTRPGGSYGVQSLHPITLHKRLRRRVRGVSTSQGHVTGFAKRTAIVNGTTTSTGPTTGHKAWEEFDVTDIEVDANNLALLLGVDADQLGDVEFVADDSAAMQALLDTLVGDQ
jgi:hypothetical protein